MTLLFFLWRFNPILRYSLPLQGFAITLIGNTKFCRNPLGKWSAQRWDLYLTIHNSQKTSMPPAGFKPTISARECPQTHLLDYMATGMGTWVYSNTNCVFSKIFVGTNPTCIGCCMLTYTSTPETILVFWHIKCFIIHPHFITQFLE
jgi:hypothetical protein